MENESMINEESTTRLLFKIDGIGDEDSDANSTLTTDVDRSTKLDNETQTQVNNSISNGTKKVCDSKNCTDYPMTRDSFSKESKEQGKEDTFPFTFSPLNSSEFNNTSLESSSPSSSSSPATFHHLQANSEQRKSYNLNAINSFHQTLQNVIMMVVRRISPLYGFDLDNDPNLNKSQDKMERFLQPPPNITKLVDKNINAPIESDQINKVSSLNKFSDIILAAKFATNSTSKTNKSKIYHAKKVKRSISRERWITKMSNKEDGMVEMYAFIVRDEKIPACCHPASAITDKRYFMCSGAILTATHAITTASCMHFADLYEQHIDAELAVLVGAATSIPYVIKINRYEMHPNYVYNVDSPDHPTYNVAILFLNCGFNFLAGVIELPKLPKGIYDDVGHMCCSQKCQLLTVIQRVNNHHLIKPIEARHLPPPVHDDDSLMTVPRRNFGLRRLYRLKKSVLSLIRRKRNPVKLAPAPSFLSKDTSLFVEKSSSGKKVQIKRQNEVTKRKKKTKDILDVIADAKKGAKSKKQKSFDINDIKSINGRRKIIDDLKERIAANLMQVDEKLTSIDWSKIEEETKPKVRVTDQEKIEKFAKEIVDETMGRLEEVLETNVTSDVGSKHKDIVNNKKNILLAMMGESKDPEILKNFAEIFSNVIKSTIPPNNASRISVSSDITIEKKDLTDPRSNYHKCPPLGSPVFRNRTLVAMVAYTCDDVESWVEWKYVSLSRNLNWIRQRTSVAQNQKPTICATEIAGNDFSEADLSLNYGDEVIQKSALFKKQSPSYLETFDNTYKPVDETLKGVREINNDNDNSRTFTIPSVHPKLSNWQIGPDPTNPSWPHNRVPPPSNKGRFVAVSNVNSNTCFTKPDGSTDCRTVSNTYTLE
ncbi:hypothetical protein G9C98_005771 [Cotesia typhae]|uniref:Peptidase S1 domain-containing protein n=2 Tax=Cotesia typhae TaxID=2053667 RepID=A0A8J5UYI7_9HYME|nr:hypothetical protein G9C98_005771 [Cotesia typhae]